MATWALKNLAMELNISILLLCPLSRIKSAEQSPVQQSDLNEVTGIAQESDNVWLLDRAFLTIIKIADNSTKKIPLHFTHKSGFTVKAQ